MKKTIIVIIIIIIIIIIIKIKITIFSYTTPMFFCFTNNVDIHFTAFGTFKTPHGHNCENKFEEAQCWY